tara:strand:- start:1070 stop:1825 length:756 start_codon:yes stop_codon:yes gene_type:complete
LFLEIEKLHVSVNGTEILKGIDLSIGLGEIHAIMGPNGSGKSTLANLIAGKPEYEVTDGTILYEGKDITNLSPDERALIGIFLSFQYPVELPGVRNRQFLKSALDAIRKHRGDQELSAREFDKIYRESVAKIDIDIELMKRGVNEGFSGGEKKRNEMLQLCLLNPRLAILDETDSGLDIDALRLVAKVVNDMRSETNSMILVTHYQRMLSYVVPDFVHVLIDGKIIKSGKEDLAYELEEKGYEWISEPLAS